MCDFNDLFFFAAVVKNSGFSAAARELGVPKSRISRRVAVLEAQLGVRLLERSMTRLFMAQGVTAVSSTPEEFTALLKSEAVRFGELLPRAQD